MAKSRYEIVLRGPLAPRLTSAVDGFTVVSSDAETTHLVGWADQSSLQGALRSVADLGLDLVAVAELPDR